MTGTSEQMGEDEGLRANRVRKRRVWMLVLLAGAIGVGVDAFLIAMARHAPAGGAGLPPLAAGLGAVLLVLLLNVGVWCYLRLVDELEYRDNLVAFSIGFMFNLSAYIAWFLFSLGGLAPDPNAQKLFIATAVVSIAAYGWMKLRAHL